MSSIDHYLPTFDFVEHHSRKIQASPEKCYMALQTIDFRDSLFIRLLFLLRGLGAATFAEARQHFCLLVENPPTELLLGLVARPWKLRGDPVNIRPDQFLHFQDPDYIKAAWSFEFEEIPNGTLVSTETRILCLDEQSTRKFRLYWFFVRPFSGLVRIEMLRLLAKAVEKQ